MTDLLQGAQDALYEALKPLATSGTLPDGAGVFQYLPEDTAPPYLVIGDITSEDASDVGDQYEEITAEVHAVFRGADRAPLLGMLHAARTVTVDQVLTAPGITFERPRFIRADATSAIIDGVTFVGLIIVKFYAEPA